jgi:hypothetical protein
MSTEPDKETMDNLLAHEQTCRRISAEKGCLYPPEAESLYWLIDSLRARLEASERDRTALAAVLEEIRALKPTNMACDYWSKNPGLEPDTVFDLCDAALRTAPARTDAK